jgi:hypothetical protein
MTLEPCAGCGAMSEAHPMVGVARDRETGEMTPYPVCHQCWMDPSHRDHTLKMHFFPASQAATAVSAADRNILVEPPRGSE